MAFCHQWHKTTARLPRSLKQGNLPVSCIPRVRLLPGPPAAMDYFSQGRILSGWSFLYSATAARKASSRAFCFAISTGLGGST